MVETDVVTKINCDPELLVMDLQRYRKSQWMLVSLVQYTHQLSKTQLWRLLGKHLQSQGQNLKNLNSQSLVRHRPIRTFVRPYPIRKFVVIQVDTGSQEKGSNQERIEFCVYCMCM